MNSIIDFFRGFGKNDKDRIMLNGHCSNLINKIYFKELAINSCITLISNSITTSEFQTYYKNEEVKADDYYLFNVESNKNKSSSDFWREVIYKMILKNECLIIQEDRQLYLVDDYKITESMFGENIYTNIRIGDKEIKKYYNESKVLHMVWGNKKVLRLINDLDNLYGKLMPTALKSYKARNSNKGFLFLDSHYPQDKVSRERLNKLLSEDFKQWFEADNAVLPLTRGQTYQSNEEKNIKGEESSYTRDIKPMLDDMFEKVAMAFMISPALIKGNVTDTDKAINNALTFCINPLARKIEEEINRKMYGKEEYLQGSYLNIDTSMVKNSDITDLANALDIFTRIGVNSVNDSLRMLGRAEIQEDWANDRYVTKNYGNVKDIQDD